MLARCWLLASLALTLVRGAPAHAQSQSYETLIEEAVTEYTRGNFQEARTLFALAHDKQPNARTFRGLGIVDYELRDYVSAIRHFEAALTDPRNKISKKQREEVERLLERSRRFVGKFRPRLEPAHAVLQLDGRALDSSASITLNPGTYQLSASAEGYVKESRKLMVRGGEDTELAFALAPARVASADDALPPVQPPIEPPAGATEASSGPPLPAVVAFAIGGAGLVTFAIAGSLGLAKEGELQACSPACPESDIEAQETQLLIADIGLVTAIAGAGIGTLLWLLDDGEERPEPVARVEPWLAPELAGASATLRF